MPLTLLLLSGSRKTFSFPPETTVGRVKELVWGSWPNGAFHTSPSCSSHHVIVVVRKC
ncbi:hypothetical protein CALVIDRAFT_535270 [Calocera viscosa TUFC12733]|uniref:UBL3-like ubiquitin domain-containing protein n=1 Tax=Calocera viscosa (strain TUFC12733) TaxID=1330018 RepID=A0A167PD88_CALVF|nr:hypothetical protein CALVIDRAFT_535270 [Calocera viscosa TUFC12733]